MRKWVKLVESQVDEDLEFGKIEDKKITLDDPLNHEVEVLKKASEEEKESILRDLEQAIMGTEKELEEAPISDIEHIGNWEKNHGFGTQDRKLLNNPKAITKIKAMWKHPEDVDFNILLVNHPSISQFVEHGEVNEEWLRKNTPALADEILAKVKPDEVNIIFSNNKGSEKVPMTGWIMAHRFSHVVFRQTNLNRRQYSMMGEMVNLINEYLGTIAEHYGIRGSHDHHQPLDYAHMKHYLQLVCTFKSARDGKLRNAYEAVHEMLAQYMLGGQIRFNDTPEQFKAGRGYYSLMEPEDDARYINNSLEELADQLEDYMMSICHDSVGKIYLM